MHEAIQQTEMENPFKNKVVFITGASSGIGQALAKDFNARGAIVIGAARNTKALEEMKPGMSTPENFHAVALDLEKSVELKPIVEKLVTEFGRIDILVNNGGISQRSNAADTSEEVDRRIMEVNYFGNIALAKAVLPYMQKQKSGHIIVISSIAGKFGFYLRSAYSASKHALHGFYESLRLEEETNGISVLMVCPGKVATNISLHALKGDGSPAQKMDQQQVDGVSAEYCAEQIIKAVIMKKEEVLIGGREIKAVTVKRLLPGLFRKIIRKQPKE